MHYLYERQRVGDELHFKFRVSRSLAGIQRGMLPYLLEIHLNGSGTEPLNWHFEAQKEMDQSPWPNCALLIDMKPNDVNGDLSLYEIVEVWGCSSWGWSPVMLHLRALFKDESSLSIDRRSFSRKREEIDDPIFTFIYLNGTVRDGVPVGAWTFPGPSSTNSALLWPRVFEYFAAEAQKVIRS